MSSDKTHVVSGMLYPEILDAQEYNVSSGGKASINRKEATAVTIGDDYCTCDFDTAMKIAEQMHVDSDTTFNKWSAENKLSPLNTNHARHIRKLVMYKEMFPLPKFVGTKEISKASLENAYRFHRLYKARWNIANKEAKAEHDKRMKERASLGQWTWNFKGRYAERFTNVGVFCPEVLLQQYGMWLTADEPPFENMMQVLPFLYHSDMSTLQDIHNNIAYIIDEYRKMHRDIHGSNGTDENILYLIHKHKNENTPRTIGSYYQYQDLLYGEYAIEHVILTLSIDGMFGKGIDLQELLRRNENLSTVLDTHRQLCSNTIPYNKSVNFNTLSRYNTHVKKLARFYDMMLDGSFMASARLKPKSLQELENKGLTEMDSMYKPTSMQQQMQQQLNKEFAKAHTIEASGYTHKDIRWAVTQIRRARMRKDMQGQLKSRKLRPSDVGAVPKYMNRWATDKYVWANKRKQNGGTMAIDMSGSMSLSQEQIEQIITALPAATIVGYAGDINETPEGVIEYFAEKGRCIKDIYDDTFIKQNGYGNNLVDVPAIMWLAKQPKPRLLVSDMEVVAISTNNSGYDRYYHEDWLDEYCIELARKHDIIILRTVDEAVKFAQKVKNIR